MQIEVLFGDAKAVKADVLALKFAQHRYGLDRYVTQLLVNAGYNSSDFEPDLGEHSIRPSVTGLEADHVVFMGVQRLSSFRYGQIRDFSRNLLVVLSKDLPEVRSIVVTLHGAGYGLDEVEAFKSQVAGIFDALSSENYPKNLRVVSFVEQDERRAKTLRRVLGEILPSHMSIDSESDLESDKQAVAEEISSGKRDFRDVGDNSESKPYIFVAMPFCKKWRMSRISVFTARCKDLVLFVNVQTCPNLREMYFNG